MSDKPRSNNVTQLFEAAANTKDDTSFPSDEETIAEDLRTVAKVYFERLVDANIDIFIDQIMVVNAVRKSYIDKTADDHKQTTKYLLLARESLLSFLLSVNGFEGTLKNTANRTVKLENTGETVFDQPIYNYMLCDIDPTKEETVKEEEVKED